MALNFFKKSKTEGSNGDGQTATEASPTLKVDPTKAMKFRQHAETVAAAGNFDYAIECYINGLQWDPDNVDMHEALHDVAERRKANGGRPAGIGEKIGGGGKDPVARLLTKEKLWAKDPINVGLMVEVMERAIAADNEEENLNMLELAYWVGQLAMETNARSKKPNKALFLRTRDLFAEIGSFGMAVDCCKYAVQMDPDNDALLRELKELEAERTIRDANYDRSYKDTVRDEDAQKALDAEDQGASRGESQQQELLTRRRAEYEEDPEDIDRLVKLVDALVATENPDRENEAIELLNKAYKETQQYRYKSRIGTIRMKQMNRAERVLRDQLKAEPNNEELKEKIKQAHAKRMRFELEEYQERVKNYPTDMGLRFELGKRLMAFRKFDEAIAAFQEARADPRNRAQALEYLGSCYMHKEWMEEAIDALREGMEAHPVPDDRLGKELRYLLMDCLEKQARTNSDVEQAQEAQRIASQILQTDINFRDIRERLNKLRELVQELRSGKSSD